MKKLGILSLILCCSAVVFGQMPGRPSGPITVTVPVAMVAEAEDMESGDYVGMVVSTEVVHVTSRVSGEILELGFHDGDFVEEDQMLYKLEDIKYVAAVKNAEAEIEQIRAKLTYATNNLNRNTPLQAQGIVSEDELENLQSLHRVSTAQLAAAEATLVSAQDDLKHCTICAPISGRVTTTSFTRGNYLTPSSGTLITIFKQDPIRVRFAISARDFLSKCKNLEELKANWQVTITLADGSTPKDKGEFEFINYSANKNTDTLQIYALFQNKSLRLIPNSTVTVHFARRTGVRLPAVPVTAVLHDNQGAYVWFLNKESVAEKRYIALGNDENGAQLVVSGLAVGDKVVCDGTHKVMVGAKIVPAK